MSQDGTPGPSSPRSPMGGEEGDVSDTSMRDLGVHASQGISVPSTLASADAAEPPSEPQDTEQEPEVMGPPDTQSTVNSPVAHGAEEELPVAWEGIRNLVVKTMKDLMKAWVGPRGSRYRRGIGYKSSPWSSSDEEWNMEPTETSQDGSSGEGMSMGRADNMERAGKDYGPLKEGMSMGRADNMERAGKDDGPLNERMAVGSDERDSSIEIGTERGEKRPRSTSYVSSSGEDTNSESSNGEAEEETNVGYTKRRKNRTRNDAIGPDREGVKGRRSEGGEALIETVRLMQANLPKLQAGSIERYWAFKRQFKELYLDSSTSVAHKLSQLYNNCDGEMQALIAHCMTLPAYRGLQVALEILDDHFGDDKTYMHQTMQRIIDGPTIGENDYRLLTQLRAQLTSLISFAENQGYIQEIDNSPTIREVMLKLDDAMQARWTVYWAGKKSNRSQHIQDVLQFVKKETRRIEHTRLLKKKQVTEPRKVHGKGPESQGDTSESYRRGPQGYKSQFKTRSREVSLATQTRPYMKPAGTGVGRYDASKCRLCGSNHALQGCAIFRSLPAHHRKTIVWTQGRCFKCLSDTHLVKDCRARSCDIDNCNEGHSRWLHEAQPQNVQKITKEGPEQHDKSQTSDNRE